MWEETLITSQNIILTAFEKIAGHISNLETVRGWIDEIVAEGISLDESITELKSRGEKEDVTFLTDIRILINEIEHLSREKTSV